MQVVFKSSPFGTQSHGNEANNSFLLWAYGQPLLVRSGHYDLYGSEHHRNWVWSTRSVNNITVNGHEQGKCSAQATGKIVSFKTTPALDIVVGEAAQSYEPSVLERFTRTVIFVKPDLVVVYDRLQAREPSIFEYWLHAVNKIDVEGQRNIMVRNGDVLCEIDFLAPQGLTFRQTDQYDPNPRARIKVREWHLTATTPKEKKRMEFVTLYRSHRINDQVPREANLGPIEGGYLLRVKMSDGEFTALLPTDDHVLLEAEGLTSRGAIKTRLEPTGRQAEAVGLEE